MRLSPGDAGVLAAVRANGPGTLAHCLGRFPTVLEAQAAGRLWEAGLVTRDMAGVYAALALAAATLPVWEKDATTRFMAPFSAGALLTFAYVEWVHWFREKRK